MEWKWLLLLIGACQAVELDFVIGIPTFPRESGAFYLPQVIRSVQEWFTGYEYEIIIYGANASIQADERISVIPPRKHPELEQPCRLRRNFGDSLDRVLWRSRLALDAAALLEYATRAKRFIRLEDDILIIKNLSDILDSDRRFGSFFHEKKEINFRYLRMIGGSQGMILSREDALNLSRHLYKYYDVAPLDWLIGDYISEQCDPRLCMVAEKRILHVGAHRSTKNAQGKLNESNMSWNPCTITIQEWNSKGLHNAAH